MDEDKVYDDGMGGRIYFEDGVWKTSKKQHPKTRRTPPELHHWYDPYLFAWLLISLPFFVFFMFKLFG